MSALLKVEDTREPKYMSVPLAGYCTECLKDIYADEDNIFFHGDRLCKHCENSMSKAELIKWFGGKFKRGL